MMRNVHHHRPCGCWYSKFKNRK